MSNDIYTGFIKIQATHRTPEVISSSAKIIGGKIMTIHYQYNDITNPTYNMKIITEQISKSDLFYDLTLLGFINK